MRRVTRFLAILMLCTGLSLGAAGISGVFAQQLAADQGTAELKNPQGEVIGKATLSQTSTGVQVQVQVDRGLTPGQHGIHVHAVGKCDPPDFMSAGGHYNPATKQHGLKNPSGAHVGDMPNLLVDANGKATYQALSLGATIAAGPASLFDADGSALVIHAGMDDEVSDPAGNSGARVACGIVALQAVPVQLPRTGDAWSGLLLLLGLGVLLLASGLRMHWIRARA